MPTNTEVETEWVVRHLDSFETNEPEGALADAWKLHLANQWALANRPAVVILPHDREIRESNIYLNSRMRYIADLRIEYPAVSDFRLWATMPDTFIPNDITFTWLAA